jgi:hypothetical protein
MIDNLPVTTRQGRFDFDVGEKIRVREGGRRPEDLAPVSLSLLAPDLAGGSLIAISKSRNVSFA